MADLHERLIAATEQPIAGMPYSTGFLRAKVDALRAVVELHAPVERVLLRGLPAECTVTECTGCLDDGPPWPCSTVKIIAAQLGVEIGETP